MADRTVSDMFQKVKWNIFGFSLEFRDTLYKRIIELEDNIELLEHENDELRREVDGDPAIPFGFPTLDEEV